MKRTRVCREADPWVEIGQVVRPGEESLPPIKLIRIDGAKRPPRCEPPLINEPLKTGIYAP